MTCVWDFILRNFKENEGNISRTAHAIGMERTHLYRKLKSPILAIEKVPAKHVDRYGIISGTKEANSVYRINSLVEKPSPDNAPSNLAIIGRYILTPDLFGVLEKAKPGKGGEIQLTDAIQWLIDHGNRFKASLVEGWWKDTGLPEDILSANRLVLDDIESNLKGKIADDSIVQGRVQIGEGTVLDKDSIVRGPAVPGRLHLPIRHRLA